MPVSLEDIDFSDLPFDRSALGDRGFSIDPKQARALPSEVLAALRARHRLRLIQKFRVASDADRFVFRESDGTYRTLEGRIVPSHVIRLAADEGIQSSRTYVETLTRQLRDGDIPLSRWQQEMMQEIKDAHLNMASIAKGGYQQMGPADFERVQQTVRQEYEYLRNFAQQISEGEVALDGRAVSRAGMYVDASRQTHHRVERLEMQKRGYNQERNILGVAEHCPECVELSNRGDDGWVPSGTLPEIGNRQCRSNCKCQIVYRSTTPGEAVDPTPFPGNQV